MIRRRLPMRADTGETLIEIVLSVFILGIAAVTVLGGMTVAIHVSDSHRKEANAGSYVRDYAEAIEGYVGTSSANYKACATLATARSNYGSSYSAPSGYSATIVGVAYLANAFANGNAGNATAFGATCTTDLGAQQLKIQVASSDNRAVESLVIVVRQQ